MPYIWHKYDINNHYYNVYEFIKFKLTIST